MPTANSAAQLPRPITLLINANSRRGKAAQAEASDLLRRAGVALGATHMPKDKTETEQLLRSEVAAGAKTVVIGGGDGTLSACADFLVNTPVAMAVLPLGTGNTFVRSIGIPTDLASAVHTVAQGHIETVDVGRVNGQIFLNSVALGLSAAIARAMDAETKKRLGLLAWPVVGGKVLWRYRPLVLSVKSQEKTFRVRTHQLVVVNGRYLAGPITAAPDASIQDGTLDVFVLGGADWRSLARVTLQWLGGSHTDSRESRYFETKALRIESLGRPLTANVDGELNEHTPLDIEILPRALRVIVPRGFKADEA